MTNKTLVAQLALARMEVIETDAPKQTIAITATFTAEPVEESLAFWMEEIELPCQIEFAPYNQVFQQLLAPTSLLSQNQKGINIILVRFEDWLRFANNEKVVEAKSPENAFEKISRNVQDLVMALKTTVARSSTPHIVCLCPASPVARADTNQSAFFQQMEEIMVSELTGVGGLYLMTAKDLAAYPVENYYDPQADKLGHIPFMPLFFTALGSAIARKIYAIKSAPHKVIVLDCDNTLWKGVVGEDGVMGIEITTPYQTLQEFIVEQQKDGMLICLCSKNHEADVVEVFSKRPEMPLKQEYIVSWRINWMPKSENIKSLAAELNLGLDSFIFIDDNPVECAQVQANCPEVLTLQLPIDGDIPRFINHVWAFDRLKVTEEDLQRTALYKQNIERERFAKENLTIVDFLAGLALKVEISEPAPFHLSRVSQLTQRTNQFNFTTIRRSEGEIQQLSELGLECRVVEVSDRFGDYGLVGVMIFTTGSDALNIDTFLLSCRVLGRGVEHRMLTHLAEIAKERNLAKVKASYIPTQKNLPALQFLESVAADFKQPQDNGYCFYLPVEFAAAVSYTPGTAEPTPDPDVPVKAAVATGEATPQTGKSALMSRIANELCSAQQVLKLIESQQRQRRQIQQPFVAPRTDTEQKLAEIWTQVLRVEEVGIHDNFFEIGGTSLLGTQVISRLRDAFEVELPLRSIFESPTVVSLAQRIEAVLRLEQPQQAPLLLSISRDKDLPLSFAQQRMWFFDQLQPGSSVYNIPSAVKLSGVLNVAALEQSLSEVIRRHEALRTNFLVVEGLPVQVISPAQPFGLSVVNLQKLPEPEREAHLLRLATEEARRPFDLAHDLLLRASLLQLDELEYVLLLTMHHIASDDWSNGVLFRELTALYNAFSTGRPSSLPTLPIQYADYAVWQRQWLQGEVIQAQLEYWKQQLAGASEQLALTTDRPRPAVQTFRGAIQRLVLPKVMTDALNALSRQQGTTLFMTLLAAFQSLLHRYTGSDDISVGSVLAGRTRTETEGLIGCFINTLVLRTDLSSNPSFLELLDRVREVALGAYAHQDLPFEKLVEELHPQRDLSHQQLFQVMFILQNATMPTVEMPGLTLKSLESLHTETAKFDLTLELQETSEGLSGWFEYNTDLFDASTLRRMANHFQTLLSGIVADPKQRLSELPLLTAAEHHQLLVEWNDTQADYPADVCIHQVFEAQVQRTPDAVAVVFESERLTYFELNARANQLAHHLQTLGVGPDVLVGIFVTRSLEMVVGLLGILKAGGAYVPLDPSYPQERLAFMLADASVSVLLTQQRLVAGLPEHGTKTVCLDSDWQSIAQQSQENPTSSATADDLAYVIYTSGSTGKPKGVQIPHRAVVNFLNSMAERPGLTNQDILLCVTSLSFDIAALEVFLPLFVGAKLVVVSREVATSGSKLLASLLDGATVLQATPATWRLLLEAGWQGTGRLKVLCGGEALSRPLASELLKRSADLWNMYGPTETTIWSATYQVESSGDAVSIGRPIANTQIYLLDSHLMPVPVGVPGELYIGGAGLARGYLNRPELTAQKFISNPLSDQPLARLYKTGDLARYLPNGNIEYLGRIDHQVKIRGFRIELGEIEAVLNQHPAVRQTVVLVREDIPGDKRLVAYVVTNQSLSPTPSELRRFLKEQLPEYMVPSAFVMLKALPLTPNGKVDLRALPIPEGLRPEKEPTYVAPQTEVERSIATIWQDVLHVEQVGVHDNIFDLGGHSLLVAQIHSKLQEVFDRDVSMIDMFKYPTINSLARYLIQAQGETPDFQRIHDRAKKQKEARNLKKANSKKK